MAITGLARNHAAHTRHKAAQISHLLERFVSATGALRELVARSFCKDGAELTKREGPFRRAICATLATGGNRVALLQREGIHLESRCNAATQQ
jgi:hypothetical protein